MAYYWLYPTASSSSNPTSSTRQYSPGLLNYYHSSQHSNYLNPVNNYYLQYQNQYRYRWPVNYGYNYMQSAPYTYDYGNTSVNESAFYRAKSPADTKSIKSKKIKYDKPKQDESHKMKPSLNSAKKSTNQEKATKNEHKIIKKIDEQKNKENIKMQLISQLTNQTQVELNKLIELKNKRRQITYLGIVTANPSDYVKKYGKVLIEPVKEQAVKEKLPVLEKMTKPNRAENENNSSENLTNITVEPSLSNSGVNANNSNDNRSLNQTANVINERTYKLAVDENGQYSLKAI